jgi:hypothetical protein
MFKPVDGYPDVASEIDTEDGIIRAIAPIAVCKATNRRVSVMSELKLGRSSEDEHDIHELSFSIVVTYGDEYHEGPFSTQDRRIAKNYIPEICRSDILKQVAIQYSELISIKKPEYIYRVTKSRSNTEKSIRKHNFLTETIIGCGYRVSESGVDEASREYWMMERSDLVSV